MSFRRECLLDLGGFREWFRGISGICEDTDAFLRARQLGYKAVFVHNAIATHVGAPQAYGRRFDARYRVAAARNLGILLVANCGLFDRRVLDQAHTIITEMSQAVRSHRSRQLVGRSLSLLGFGIGLARGARYCRGWGPVQPRRHDAQAAVLRNHLSERPPTFYTDKTRSIFPSVPTLIHDKQQSEKEQSRQPSGGRRMRNIDHPNSS